MSGSLMPSLNEVWDECADHVRDHKPLDILGPYLRLERVAGDDEHPWIAALFVGIPDAQGRAHDRLIETGGGMTPEIAFYQIKDRIWGGEWFKRIAILRDHV